MPSVKDDRVGLRRLRLPVRSNDSQGIRVRTEMVEDFELAFNRGGPLFKNVLNEAALLELGNYLSRRILSIVARRVVSLDLREKLTDEGF